MNECCNAVLKAERDRLLALTPEEVVEEAVAVCLGYTKPLRCNDVAENHGPHNCGDCYRLWSWDNDADVVRAALPVLLAPEVAKREAAEKERDEWRGRAERQYDETVAQVARVGAAEAEVARLRGALRVVAKNCLGCGGTGLTRTDCFICEDATTFPTPHKCNDREVNCVRPACVAARAALGGAK